METVYKIQLGEFSQKEDADALLVKAESVGVALNVVEEDGLFKVQSDSYKKKGNADKQAEKLREMEFEAEVVTISSPAAPKPTNKSLEPYAVKVDVPVLNIRAEPSLESDIVGTLPYGEKCAIIEESTGASAGRWGKLEVGTGWICLEYTEKS